MSVGIFIVPSGIKITMRNFTSALKGSIPVIRTAAAIAVVILITANPQTIKSAALTAASNCLNTIIPCIFPMLTMSFFILESGFPVRLSVFTDGKLKKLFGLSGNCLEGVILGLSGGYNTAVKSAVRLFENKRITREEAKRIALFFSNPGISFAIILTGVTLSGSFITGLRLYIESMAVNILSAFLYNKFNKNTKHISVTASNSSAADALVKAVQSASSAIISISFNIIFFACLTAIICNLIPVSPLNNLITLTAEICNAVIFSVKEYPLFVTSGVLTFGGLCIFIQNLSDIRKLNIKPSVYLITRLLSGIISAVAEFIYSRFFPYSHPASTAFQIKITKESSTAGTLALIFLAAVYLLSVKDIRQKRIYDK